MLVDINKAGFDAFIKRVDLDLFSAERKTDLQEQITRFFRELFPQEDAEKIAALVRVNTNNINNISQKSELAGVFQYMATVLQYRPEWVNAPMEEIALSAAREANTYPSFAAGAQMLGRSVNEHSFHHMLSTFSKGFIIPSRFAALNDAYPDGTLPRHYNGRSLFFGFLSGKVPTKEGTPLTLIIPVYAPDKEITTLFSDPTFGTRMEGVWNKWMAIAQHVGHDDLHHMYRGFESSNLPKTDAFGQYRVAVNVLDGNTHAANGLDAREVFARAFHAARMQTQEDVMPQLLNEFFEELIALHTAIKPSTEIKTNSIVYFLIASCFDHAIAHRHQLTKEVLDLFENAMNTMQIYMPGSSKNLFDNLSGSSNDWWKSINADPQRASLDTDLNNFLGGTGLKELSGLQALWYAQLTSGSLAARYAFQDRRVDGKICTIGYSSIDSVNMAESISKALVLASDTRVVRERVGRTCNLLDESEAGIRHCAENFLLPTALAAKRNTTVQQTEIS